MMILMIIDPITTWNAPQNGDEVVAKAINPAINKIRMVANGTNLKGLNFICLLFGE